MEKILTLPAGYDEVPVSEIPWRIAEALYLPELDTADSIIAHILKKVFPYGEPNGYEEAQLEDLTDNDWEAVQAICKKSNLSPIKIGMSEAEFRSCKKAFDDCKLDWVLIPLTQNIQRKVLADHEIFLADAILGGEVIVYDKLTHIPFKQPIDLEKLHTAFMTAKDFTRYVAKFHLQVCGGENEVGQTSALHTSNKAHDKIPGKMPRIAIGKLAVKAAWEIECETGRHATADEVIERLQKWAEAGNDGYLHSKIKFGVKWVPKRGKIPKEYKPGACGKTLETWHASRD
ncbi:MAG: hypothetical protein ACLQHK_03140 [Gallionellaceae bacterium]